MGNSQAQAFAEQVEEGAIALRVALSYHVRANHYPPLPVAYIDVSERVIKRVIERAAEAADEGYDLHDSDVWDEKIDLPSDIEPEPRSAVRDADGNLTCTVGVLVEILHLDAFLGGE